jgi:IclR family acetate operon transcriptional repressor
MPTSQQDTYYVPAVEKAAAILEYLCHAKREPALRDIHMDLNIPKTTAYSILNTLIHCGFVQKRESGCFIPTLRLFTLGTQARNLVNGGHVLLPYLEKLRDITGFTVFFSIYDNGEQVIMEKLDGSGAVVTFRAYVGERKRLNTSSGGKAISAYLPPAERELMFVRGLDKFTPNSIATKEDLLEHFEMIRNQGYAVDNEEGEIGVRCLGAPVFIHGQIYGAVSIATLKDNLPFTDIPKYVKLVKTAAAEISEILEVKAE